MSGRNRHFGIDWAGNRIARSVAYGIMAGGLINLLSVLAGYTRPADSWWLIGSVWLISAAIGLGLHALRKP